MWDWGGGRFSLWSAIGLPIAIDLGFERFLELLEGADEMDRHYYETSLETNAPVILALLSLWNCTFLGAQSQAILPYDQSLHMLSAYLQQAEMESVTPVQGHHETLMANFFTQTQALSKGSMNNKCEQT